VINPSKATTVAAMPQYGASDPGPGGARRLAFVQSPDSALHEFDRAGHDGPFLRDRAKNRVSLVRRGQVVQPESALVACRDR